MFKIKICVKKFKIHQLLIFWLQLAKGTCHLLNCFFICNHKLEWEELAQVKFKFEKNSHFCKKIQFGKIERGQVIPRTWFHSFFSRKKVKSGAGYDLTYKNVIFFSNLNFTYMHQFLPFQFAITNKKNNLTNNRLLWLVATKK